MKTLCTLAGLFFLTAVQAQYFQQRYNYDYATPKLRNERLNSGIVTAANFINFNPTYFYNVGIGTSYNNPALQAPDNTCDRMRFIQLGTSGLTMFSNMGYQFASVANRWYNAAGNSIAEVKDGFGTGGYVAVGNITNNPLTEANGIPGNSDILFARINSAGMVITARRIDLNQSTDAAWCIRRSVTLFNGQPTWLICGQSQRGNQFTDCFVARVLQDGTIIWARRYNFDFGGGQFNSAICIARQLCEGPNGFIYVVGTIQDVPAAANGIDGLAFCINPNGAVVWANNYHAFTDDEFHAVRFTSTGTLAVGGFTNLGAVAPVTSHMLFTELNTAAGVVLSQNVLRAAAGGTTYTSRCYDLTEAPGNQFYLAGPVITQNGTYQMMYRTNGAGAGLRWYRYNRMNYAVGFGVDFANDLAGPGITYFSSIKDSINGNFSDGHILRTDFNGRTCKVCPDNAPVNQPIQLQRAARNNRNNPTGTPNPLIWATFNYRESETCNDATISCDGPVAGVAATASSDASSSKLGNLVPAVKVFPNPVVNLLRIQLEGVPPGTYAVTVVDAAGKVVLQKQQVYQYGTGVYELDMSAQLRGIYLLSLRNGNTVLQQKVVKQ